MGRRVVAGSGIVVALTLGFALRPATDVPLPAPRPARAAPPSEAVTRRVARVAPSPALPAPPALPASEPPPPPRAPPANELEVLALQVEELAAVVDRADRCGLLDRPALAEVHELIGDARDAVREGAKEAAPDASLLLWTWMRPLQESLADCP